MPGRLGKANLPAAANTEVYSCPNNALATIVVNATNRSSSPIKINLAITDNDLTPQAEDYFEYQLELCANGSYERGGIVLAERQKIIAWANDVGISAQVWGWLERP
jgi:hypothetical protein